MATIYKNCTIINNYNYQTNENDDCIEEIDDDDAYHNVRWKQFREYRYLVSTDGRVKNDITGKILRPRINNKGYLYVGLHKSGEKQKNFFLHRMVGECFIPNPDNLETIDHRDGNPLNCNVENLRWASRQTQNIHQRKRIYNIDNNTEVRGVRYHKKGKRYEASIKIDGGKKTKSFAIGKYGRSKALHLASEWRSHQESINPDYILANTF